MDVQKIFEILEIRETKDEETIKGAYRSKLVSVNPEDNPEGFKRLREAYEAALKYASVQTDTASEEEANDPVSLYLKRLESVYCSLSRRLDISEWEGLLRDELLDDLDLSENAMWGLFRYLSEHYELPTRIWRLLEQTFQIQQEQQRFKEHLPVNFVDFIIWSCSEEAEISQFPFEQLSGSDTADYDEFIHQLGALSKLMSQESEYEDRDAWLKELLQKIAYLDTLNISHPRLELQKANYAFKEGRKEDALKEADRLLTPETADPRILLGCAAIYKNCERKEDAEQIYRTLLESDAQSGEEQTTVRQTGSDVYTAAMALADMLFDRKEYVQAKDYAFMARRFYNTNEVQQLLIDCSNGIIEQMTGPHAPEAELSIEEGLQLADCYMQTGRAAEGVAYFEKHPILTEDTSDCHRAKAILFNSGEKYEDALTETLLWRKSLKADSETDDVTLAQNYVFEARVHEQFYKAQADKQSKEAVAHKDAAFAAFETASQLIPGDINILINKLLFVRILGEEESSKDYYQQAADLSEEIKTLDEGYFWAYYYAQEAYEKLGNAQKVIDNFYEAKRIYGGIPEIYERAAKVFQHYGQYRDLGHILQQAEDAGVTSAYLKVTKIEFLREEAKSEEQIREVDTYSERTIADLEEELQKAEQEEEEPDAKELEQLKRMLAEAYRQRVLLHDDNSKIEEFKNLDDIERWAKRSLELADMFANRYFLGYFYMYEKVDYKEAYKHLKVCEQKGTNHWVFRRIALCHEEWEQWDDAIEYYKKGADLAPEHDDYLWRIGWLYRRKYYRTGQREYYEEALKYLDLQMERFGENVKDYWKIWWQYSDLHSENREYEKALEDIEKELQTDNQSRNWGHKGEMLELLGRYDEAEAAYEKGMEVSIEKNKDYAYAYSQMYDRFCLCRSFEEGLAWFEEKQANLQTDEQRTKNLGHIKNLHLFLGNWQKALDALTQIYGDTTLTDYVCDSWEQEGKRIDDLLDAYQFWLSDEELDQKARAAAALMECAKGQELKEDHEAKRKAYSQIAYCYADYLLDDETALLYFQKALEQAKLAGDNTSTISHCSVIEEIMGCLWRLGRSEEAVPYRKLYMETAAKDFEECAALGKSVETMFADKKGGRNNRHHLFKLAFYCGEYEEAEKWLKQMETAPWCWHCTTKECTEEWECKGYLALIHGRKEEAYKCFQQADACALRRNDDARRELKRLRLNKQ